MSKRFCVAVVLVGLAMTSGPYVMAQSGAQSAPPATTREFVLSGEDWKLGSFEMDEGENQGASLPTFDDHAFRTVEVPGEVLARLPQVRAARLKLLFCFPKERRGQFPAS